MIWLLHLDLFCLTIWICSLRVNNDEIGILTGHRLCKVLGSTSFGINSITYQLIMSKKTCCVPNCPGDEILHLFPNPSKKDELFWSWVMKIRGEIMINNYDAKFIFNNRRVCHKHFESKYFHLNNKLRPGAVPTLHLPGQGKEVVTSAHQHSFTTGQQNQPAGGPSMEIKIPEDKNEEMDGSKTHKAQELIPGTPNTGCKISKTEIVLCSQLKATQKQLKRMQLKRNTFKKRLQYAQKLQKSNAFAILSGKVTKSAKILLETIVTQSIKRSKGRRYTTDQKILALSLYKRAPKAYRILSSICGLPQQSTIAKVLDSVNIKPGLNEKVLDHLKKKVAKMPRSHRYCVLLFDEMSIMPHLSFSTKKGKISGFVDGGNERSNDLADHALVFMVRGIHKKYKQPISYTFCKGTTKTMDLVRLIEDIIRALSSIGFIIIGTVCDQGQTNQAAVNYLLNKTKSNYLRRGEEWRETFFEVDKVKVVPLYDPPHLIKGIRNNLITKDLEFKIKGQNRVAKWKHLELLYKRNPSYRGVRLVHKLTARHVIPKMIPKMRVKYATQVFSRSVGVAMGYLSKINKLPKECEETAEVLMFFDRLFDSVNGSSTNSRGKVYKTAVTRGSPHHQLWRQSIPVLQTMAFRIAPGKTGKVPSLKSWIKTIKGFQTIIQVLRENGITSVLLRNFNQDPLENFFGAIRAHGCQNTKPDVVAFEAAYKTLCINNISSQHSTGANCEMDNDSCLQSLKYFVTGSSDCQADDKKIELQYEHLFLSYADTQTLLKSETTENKEKVAAVAYCSGWVLKLMKTKIFKTCSECNVCLAAESPEEFHEYIVLKEYMNKGWLSYPSLELFNCFMQIEHLILTILNDNDSASNVKLYDYLKTIILYHVNFDFFNCHLHKVKLIEFMCTKMIKFVIVNWCQNINNILDGKSQFVSTNDAIQVYASNYYLKNKCRKSKK